MNWLKWAPRIISIIFIIFISLLAFDTENIVGLLIQLIPSCSLIILTGVAWKWEKIGGYLWLVIGVVFTLFFKTYTDAIVFLIVSAPAFITGGLFLTSTYYPQKKQKKK